MVGVGLLGCGTVGSALVELLGAEVAAIAGRTGLRFVVRRVAVRDVAAACARVPSLDPAVFTDDSWAVVDDPAVQVVVEVMGGVEPARSLVLAALEARKPVVTANKALLASCGPELHAAAEAAHVDLLFEAAVAGGVPVVRALRESLAGEPITRVTGIVNGTTNYILTRMASGGASYAEALRDAQRLGFAEADPADDVGGGDAAAKAAILATLAFGVDVRLDDVYTEGIGSLTADDVGLAAGRGQVVKLLAVAEVAPPAASGAPRVAVRVHPALLDADHPLASVNFSANAVLVEGGAVGQLMFYGPGAGGGPTASAVLGDLIDAAGGPRRGVGARLGALAAADVQPIGELRCGYLVGLVGDDGPAVPARVAGVFAAHGVPVRSVTADSLRADDGASAVGAARLTVVTGEAGEADLRAALADLGALDGVRQVGAVLRCVGTTG